MGHRFLIGVALLAVLAACGPDPTPFAVTPVFSPTAPATETTEGALEEASPMAETRLPRYGVLPNAAGFVPVEDLLAAGVVVEQLVDMPPVDVLTTFDLVVGFGTYDGWETAPMQYHVALVLNTNRPPLDQAALVSILQRIINAEALAPAVTVPGLIPLTGTPLSAAEAHTRLANAGYPDGLLLSAAIEPIPGIEGTMQQFTEAAIELITPAQTGVTPHVQFITWVSDAERQTLTDTYGAANITDLYALPISYNTAGSFNLSFGAGGWPRLIP